MKSLKLPKQLLSTSVLLATALSLGIPDTALAQAGADLVIESEDREAVNAPEAVPFLSNRFKVVGRSYQCRTINDGKERGSVPGTRPYYSFPLAQLRGPSGGSVSAATLTFLHPQISFFGPENDEAVDSSETMTFFPVERFDVDGLRALPGRPAAFPGLATQAELSQLQAIFDDLGDGTPLGTLTATTANNGKLQTISLNSAGVRALNAAINNPDQSHFIVGADLTSGRGPGEGLPRGFQERIFRGADDSGGAGYPEIKLGITFGEPPAPAPAISGGILGLGLLGTGLGGLGVAGLRRRKRR